MEQNRSYVTNQITFLNTEIHILKNRLNVAEIQLENALENIKMRRQLWAKIREELFSIGCVALGVLLILIFTHNH